jgi:hypothetical protein
VGTLIKLIKEGEHKECIKIMVLYIISNAAMIVCTGLNEKLQEKGLDKKMIIFLVVLT